MRLLNVAGCLVTRVLDMSPSSRASSVPDHQADTSTDNDDNDWEEVAVPEDSIFRYEAEPFEITVPTRRVAKGAKSTR
jgi:hypothetical protein